MLLFLFLVFLNVPYINTLSFFHTNEILWCCPEELELTQDDNFAELIKYYSVLDQQRLQKLKSKKPMWHLSDSYLGFNSLKNPKNIAWNFSLWDLAPSKGVKSQIVIIDQKRGLDCFSQGEFDKKASKFKNQGLSQNRKPCIQESEKGLLGLTKSNGIFSKDLKKAHGQVTHQIIQQLAPNAKIKCEDIFDGKIFSNKELLYKTLKNTSKNIDVLHLGLQVDVKNKLSNLDQKTYKELSKFSNIVAPSGNDFHKNKEGYPASWDCVNFDIGSYNQKCEISKFSQCEKNIGPRFIMPGEDICCLVRINDQVYYLIVSGTSVSAAYMTGFLALVYSEFKNTFTDKQILEVVKISSSKKDLLLSDQEKVLWGRVDMRTCLLMFYVLKFIKKHSSKKNFQTHFIKYAQIINVILNIQSFVSEIMEEDKTYYHLVKNLSTYAREMFFFDFINYLAQLTCLVSGVKPNSSFALNEKIDIIEVELLQALYKSHCFKQN